MAFKCSHLNDPQRCNHPGCKHYDCRPLWEQLFSHNPNSALAAELYRTNRPLYDAARNEAIARGALPTAKIPRCLQDE